MDESFTEAGYTYPAAAGGQWLDLSGRARGTAGRGGAILTSSTQYTLSWSVGNVSGGVFGTDSSVLLFVDGAGVRRSTNSQAGTTMDWKRFTQAFVPGGFGD